MTAPSRNIVFAFLFLFGSAFFFKSCGPCPTGGTPFGAGPPETYEQGCMIEDKTRRQVQHGPWTYWDKAGKIEKTGEYSEGSMIGTWTWYHPNGVKRLAGSFVAGNYDGPWTEWNAEGQLIRTALFEKGKKQGLWTWWHSTGVRAREGNYEQDQMTGTWYYWDAEGRPVNQVEFSDGKPGAEFKAWSEDSEDAS